MIASLNFPDIFNNSSTNIVTGHAATSQNLRLMLHSTKNSFFGDPYFGTNLKRLIFEQNNNILRDVVIDDIYNSISAFMPQIGIKREDIEIVSDGTTIFANMKLKNLIDFNLEEVSIALFNIEELE